MTHSDGPRPDDVSRETPAVPEVARRVFSSHLELAVRYADLLATQGVLRGLIGPREVPRLWERHLLNCAQVAAAVPRDARVCDVGSGAGLPGMVLALCRPDLELTLVEPLLRRTTFLEEVVTELALDRVEVVRGRADALHGKRTFEVVTSRAVAPLSRLLGWSMPLVAPSGAMVAMKGSSAAAEVEDARRVLEQLGCAEPEVLTFENTSAEASGSPPTYVVRVAWADPRPVGSVGSRSNRAEGSRRSKRGSRSKGRSSRPSSDTSRARGQDVDAEDRTR